ncbi:MAG TPA: galactose oxidase-like domain-containing protein [Pyrinomonadaceae bacterium]|nr:galactose oxidase-like domain-containing protein [Pyrinomonadaceae bacterium]
MLTNISSLVGKYRRTLLALGCAFLLGSQLLTTPRTVANATAAARAFQGDPSVVGQWSATLDLGVVTIHTHLLPTGKVLFWSRQQNGGGDALGFSQTYTFDPVTNSFLAFPFNSTTNLFCSGHSFLPDGRLLVAGGHQGADNFGEPHTNIFDPATNTWTRAQDMNAGRWYPTTCPLGTGEALVVSGTIQPSVLNTLPQVFQPGSGTWRSLTSAQQGLQLYPWMLLAPNGRVFNSGPDQFTRYLATSGTGAWSDGPTSNGGFRDYGSSVMYDDGKVLIAGGGAPTNTAEVVNISRETPAWRFVGSMAFTRRQMNATLLPDGHVLVTGGTSGGNFSNAIGSVFAAEDWNPSTETWTTLASMAERRLYHSTAILLPDGRVMVGGGGFPASDNGDSNHTTIQYFSPPYLFRGARPSITSAPASAGGGEQIFVGTPNASSISKVTLVRLSSVTHSFNQNQHINVLSFRQAAGGLNVSLPRSGTLCPPGHYMLFLVNSSGVPSVASIIQVTSAASQNAIDDSRYFVRQQYYDFFNREPDDPGLAFWTNNITTCGNTATCYGQKRLNVARAFWESGEFQDPLRANNDPLFFPTPPGGIEYNTEEFVKKCYRIYLRKEGEAGGVAFWRNGLNSCIAQNPSNTSQCYNNTINAFLLAGDYRNRFSKP